MCVAICATSYLLLCTQRVLLETSSRWRLDVCGLRIVDCDPQVCNNVLPVTGLIISTYTGYTLLATERRLVSLSHK